MVEIEFLPAHEIQRVALELPEGNERLALLADMCRLNTLVSVKRTGSENLGASFSSLDILSYLYYSEMNTAAVGPDNPDRDIFLPSQMHDNPGFYAVLYGLGFMPEDRFLNMLRSDDIPGIQAKGGPLGMSISKGRELAWEKWDQHHGGRVFVMTGDGEWQEGENLDALRTAAHQKVSNLYVLMEHNKIRSDKPAAEIQNLGDLENEFAACGWHVARCDGHDFSALAHVFDQFRNITDRPKILIADTVEGRGVTFMEHPAMPVAHQGLDRPRAGAPDDDSYLRAHAELWRKIETRVAETGLVPVTLALVPLLDEAQMPGSIE